MCVTQYLSEEEIQRLKEFSAELDSLNRKLFNEADPGGYWPVMSDHPRRNVLKHLDHIIADAQRMRSLIPEEEG